jgi:FMN hydrolase / 5-amino-6-(5-phospho-D-ribitylamino)uracil phosphatase
LTGAPDQEPPTLLLDVMDTLVQDPFWEALPAFFGLSREELLAVKHPTAWVEFERGERTPEDYYANMFADRRTFNHAAFEAHVQQAYDWIPGMETLLARLATRGIEMHALSNYPVWYQMVDERLGLSRFLRWTFVSCETGVRKPDPQAYLGVIAHLGGPAERFVFVDDREVNCAAARRVGMHATRFVSADALEAELRGLGILA